MTFNLFSLIRREFSDWAVRIWSLIRNPRYLIDLLVSAFVAYTMGLGYLYYILKEHYNGLDAYVAAGVPGFQPVNDRLLNWLGPALPWLDKPSIIVLFAIAISFSLYVLWKMPEKIPFILKAFGFAAFAKHIVGPITNLVLPLGAYRDHFDSVHNDMFFSGHTANTFFAYLLSRKNTKVYKYFIMAGVAFEIACVLLMKIHYTIDVFAAPFVAYGMFMLANRFFGKNKVAYEKLLPEGSEIRTIA